MELSHLTREIIWEFSVVFARIVGLFISLPGISQGFVAVRLRFFMSFAVSLVICQPVAEYIVTFPASKINMTIIIFQELLVGAFLGTIIKIFLGSAAIAGNIISLQSSLSSATMFDPTQDTQNPVIGNFYTIFSVTLLFVLDIHHLMIAGIIRSFEILNFANFVSSEDLGNLIVKTVGESFILGIKISAPYVLVSFIVNIISACIARLMPSLSVFFLITPLQIWLSLLILYFTFLSSMEWYLSKISELDLNL